MNNSYERMLEIIEELQSRSKIEDTLEIGCGDGTLVRLLRNRGLSSIGIDIDDCAFAQEGVEQGYLVKLVSHGINLYFGDKRFDLIFANRVLSRQSVSVMIADRYFNGNLFAASREAISETAKWNTEKILEASLRQLRDGGYFVGTIDSYENLIVTSDMAESLGYRIIRLQLTEVVLQTPEH